jgi:hypothetical protein
MKRKILIGLFFIPLLFWRCSNDFDVNDAWKDYTVVYGILNKADSLQIIRVSKSFLGNGDALSMAQVADSIYYNKPLSVNIEEWLNGNLSKTIILHKDSSIARESGVFANNKNYYYVTSEPLSSSGLYKLVIQVNGKTVTSETQMIPDFYINNVPSTIAFSTTSSFRFNITTPANARIFQPYFRFFYYELTATDTVKKYMDFELPTYTSITLTGGEIINVEYPGSKFYEFVASNIKYNSHVIKRYAAKGSILISVYAGSNELYAYLQVSAPTSGLLLDKPTYSNISNGIGLFTSRFTKYIPAKSLTSRTLDSLALGVYTKNLLFQTDANTSPFWDQFP